MTDKRVIFILHGNNYRLIVDIEYRLKIVFIVWFGTHKAYDKIDVKKVSYIRPIKNEQHYEEGLQRVYKLLQKDIQPDSKESDELEVLSVLVKEYENEHYPIPSPNPVEAIKFRLEHINMSESELSDILGYRSRKSEILSGKRKLNLTVIRKLAEQLHISAEMLIQLSIMAKK